MKTVTSLLVLSAIFAASAAYADGFHIENRSHTNLLATVYFDGKTQATLTMKPGQKYTHSLWHNLVVSVTLLNPKTKQMCSLIVEERRYTTLVWGLRDIYEPKVPHQYSDDCPYYSSFNQANWKERKAPWQKYSTVDIWAPWP